MPSKKRGSRAPREEKREVRTILGEGGKKEKGTIHIHMKGKREEKLSSIFARERGEAADRGWKKPERGTCLLFTEGKEGRGDTRPISKKKGAEKSAHLLSSYTLEKGEGIRHRDLSQKGEGGRREGRRNRRLFPGGGRRILFLKKPPPRKENIKTNKSLCAGKKKPSLPSSRGGRPRPGGEGV